MASASHTTLSLRAALTGAVSTMYYSYIGASFEFALGEGAHLAVSRAVAESLLEGVIEAIEKFIPSFALHLADSARIDLATAILTGAVNSVAGRFTGYNYLDDKEVSGFVRGVVYNAGFCGAADVITSFTGLMKAM